MVFGCAQQGGIEGKDLQKNDLTLPENNTGQENPSSPPQDNGTQQENNGTSFYEPFTVERFEQVKGEGKVILLEFYANWCPICNRQKPELEQAFVELNNSNIAGFQVNYNDSETDENEKALARKFGVAYQHTHVVIDSSENILLKELTEWSKEETISKLETAASGTGAAS
ncbi:MAG: thioredoxin family protein [Candidatus Diapherotrites archaeon]|nr:thioredoxin family protein [Candidatus Diapherotrites archaeon]